MSGPPPPPPPPHGENPKTTRSGGLPPGKYDVFIIPEHSAGAGFLYLPSLRTNTNSFVAGFATALALMVLGQSMAPAFRQWWSNFQGMGNMGMMMLTVAVGLGAWSLGRTQQDGAARENGHAHGARGGHGSPGEGFGGGAGGGFGGGAPGGYGSSSPPPPPPQHEPPPQHQSPPPPPPQPETPRQEQPKPSWQQRPESSQQKRPESSQQQRPESAQQKRPEPAQPQRPEPAKQQRPEPAQQQSSPKPPPKPETAKGTWERAREETRRREEERKAKEETQRKREATAARLKELREKEARERAQREKEKQEREAKERAEQARKEAERERKEQELRDELAKKERELREMREKDQRERELREQRAKELQEKLERERLAREKERMEQEARAKREQEERARKEQEERARKEQEERARKEQEEKAKKEEEERQARKGSSYAFAGVGERINPWPNGKPTVPAHQPPPAAPAASSAPSAGPSTPNKKPPAPTARTYVDEEETFSYRPYDKPKRTHRKSNSDFSESSWTPSQSTARTTPPPSMRMPYTTKDPDKIVIRAVYGFLNQFSKTPGSQLISGQAPVTDGLILRITTEGLFIDDDVRGVPQREWDVKAWTLKQVEVWCPAHVAALVAKEDESSKKGASAAASANPSASFFRGVMGGAARREPRGAPKTLQGDEADAYLAEMLRECKNNCRLGLLASDDYHRSAASRSAASNSGSRTGSTNDPQTGEWRAKGLHLLRATIRDQEGKRYLFVIGEEESWKMSVGLQRLRKGSQVRGLGVVGMSALETRTTLEMLGWAS